MWNLLVERLEYTLIVNDFLNWSPRYFCVIRESRTSWNPRGQTLSDVSNVSSFNQLIDCPELWVSQRWILESDSRPPLSSPYPRSPLHSSSLFFFFVVFSVEVEVTNWVVIRKWSPWKKSPAETESSGSGTRSFSLRRPENRTERFSRFVHSLVWSREFTGFQCL